MKRIKNDKSCKQCKSELLHGHPFVFCNFCTNEKKRRQSMDSMKAWKKYQQSKPVGSK